MLIFMSFESHANRDGAFLGIKKEEKSFKIYSRSILGISADEQFS